MDLKSVYRKNFIIFLISLIVVPLFGFNNNGIIYVFMGIPLILIITLIFNVILVLREKEFSLKVKILTPILATLAVILANVIVVSIVGSVLYYVFGFDKFMITQF